jgi:hypothetical protein
MGISIIRSLRRIDWPFSDIKFLLILRPKAASTCLLLEVQVGVNPWAGVEHTRCSRDHPSRTINRRTAMTSRKTRMVYAACILAALASPMDLAAQDYDVTTLQGLGGGAGANSINDRGWVAGQANQQGDAV